MYLKEIINLNKKIEDISMYYQSQFIDIIGNFRTGGFPPLPDDQRQNYKEILSKFKGYTIKDKFEYFISKKLNREDITFLYYDLYMRNPSEKEKNKLINFIKKNINKIVNIANKYLEPYEKLSEKNK